MDWGCAAFTELGVGRFLLFLLLRIPVTSIVVDEFYSQLPVDVIVVAIAVAGVRWLGGFVGRLLVLVSQKYSEWPTRGESLAFVDNGFSSPDGRQTTAGPDLFTIIIPWGFQMRVTLVWWRMSGGLVDILGKLRI